MKKCNEINPFIDSISENGIDSIPENIQEHIKTCTECAEKLVRAKSVIDSLSRMKKERIECPDSVFTGLASRMEAAKLSSKNKKGFFDIFRHNLIPAGAFSALIVLFFLGFFFFQNTGKNDSEPKLIASYDVERNKPVTLTLNYTSSEDIENVKFSIHLDSEISFESDIYDVQKQKTASWSGSLKKGKNEIPFVVNASKNGVWNIKARAEFQGLIHERKVVLTITDEKIAVAYLEFPPH